MVVGVRFTRRNRANAQSAGAASEIQVSPRPGNDASLPRDELAKDEAVAQPVSMDLMMDAVVERDWKPGEVEIVRMRPLCGRKRGLAPLREQGNQ